MGRVLVTGIGCVTPIGIGRNKFCSALRDGVSGISALSLCDPTPHECKVAAQVLDFDPTNFMDTREARALPRVAQLAVAAAKLAWSDAGLEAGVDRRRVGIVLGTSSGPIAYSLEQHAIYFEKGARRVHPSMPAFAHNGVIASECAIQLGVHGPALAISSACTSAADAIGLGASMLQNGMVDVMLVGGADAPICPAIIAGFDRLAMMPRSFNATPQAAARPFASDREGLVLGEGAAVLVLERESHAMRRDAQSSTELVGFGATCDAHAHFKQEESGREAIAAIELALASAGIEPSDVDFVNAHGTGTRENDPFEIRVLRSVFGAAAERLSIGSSKSQFGHLLGAAAAVEAAAVVVGLDEQFVPPTLNLDTPDPECAANHVVGKGLSQPLQVGLSTSFGFGSRNAALLFRRCHEA